MRRRWGCDGPAADGQAVFATSCPRCSGTRDDCALCRGTNEYARLRCPAVEAAGTEEWRAAWLDALNGDGWPEPGDLLDQTAFFADAVRIARAEKSRIEAEKQAAMSSARSMIGADG